MKSKNNFQNVLLWMDRLGRWVISLFFLVAAVPKLFNVQGFAALIDAYAILPDILLLPTAIVLPVLEIFLAMGLLLNRFKSKIGVGLVLLSFIILLSCSIWQGLDIDCGCFGLDDQERTAFHGLRVALVRDIVLLIPILYSIWYHRYRCYIFQTKGD